MNHRVATAIVILLFLVMAGVPATADAASTNQAETELSTLPKIEAYLGAMGIHIDSVVVQQGRLNYAGPNCPGAEWNCTTSSMVVQISTSTYSAANVAQCSPGVNVTLLTVDECIIVQSSLLVLEETTNSATCDMDATGAEKQKQKCKIRQSSKKGNNYAEVRARTTQRGGSAQFAKQEAVITQESESGNNTAKITLSIQQTLVARETAAVTQGQDACQYAKVDQVSTNGGDNSSDVQQYQSQVENADSGGNIVQNQNITVCQFESAFTRLTSGRNATAEVTQTSTDGNLSSNLWQVIDQNQDADNAGSPAASVTQTQSNPGGGLVGDVLQTTLAPGVIRSTGTQDEPQTQHADPVGPTVQDQDGPEFCCAEQLGGTAANVNIVTQSNVQRNDTGGVSQSSLQSGMCSTTGGGECSVDQTYTSNSGTSTFSQSDEVVVSNRACTDGGEDAVCAPPPPPPCEIC